MASIISEINWIANGERADSVTLNRPLLEYLSKYEAGVVTLSAGSLIMSIDASIIDAAVSTGDLVSINTGTGDIVQTTPANKDEILGIIDVPNSKLYISGLVPDDILTVNPNEKYYLNLGVPGAITNVFTTGSIYLGMSIDIDGAGALNPKLFLKISGTNAETLDGISSESFLRSDVDDNALGNIDIKGTNHTDYNNDRGIPTLITGSNFGSLTEGRSGAHYVIGLRTNDDDDSFSIVRDTNIDGTYDDVLFQASWNNFKYKTFDIIHTGNASSVTVGNADTLDSLDSTQFLRSDVNDTGAGDYTWTGTNTYQNSVIVEGTSPSIKLNDTSGDDDFWMYCNSDQFQILTDRDNNGTADGVTPFVLNNSTSLGYIYGHEVMTINTADTRYVEVAGDNMTGILTTSAGVPIGIGVNPSGNLFGSALAIGDSDTGLRGDSSGLRVFHNNNEIVKFMNTNIRYSKRIDAEYNIRVGRDTAGDSNIDFWDDNSDTWRTLSWDDSKNSFVLETNDGVQGHIILHEDSAVNGGTY